MPYPSPRGYADISVNPSDAAWSDECGEFALPYEVVRTARDPDEKPMTFLQSTCEAAATTATTATTANGDRKQFER
jgi:hypothetical protein